MKQLHQPAYAALVLRMTLGIVMIAHSLYLKLFIFTLPGTANFFASLGLPSNLAYLVFIIEAIGGIGLVIGYQTRIISVLLIPVLLGATWAHFGSGWLFTNTGGGWEYPLVLVAMSVVQLLLGDGAYSISKTSTAKP